MQAPGYRRRWLVLLAVPLLFVLGATGWRPVHRHFELVRVRSDAGSDDPESALPLLQSLRDSDPANAEAAYLQAVVERRLGRTQQARDSLKAAADLGWSRIDIQRQHFLLQFQSGEIVDAEPRLRQMIDEGCDDALAVQVYECLVQGYLVDARINDAIYCVENWLQWQPRSAAAHFMRSEIFDAVHNKPALEQEYYEILGLDPFHRKSLLRLAFVLLEKKEFTTAKQYLDRYLKRWPDDGVAQMGFASCQREQGDTAAARAMFERALSTDLPPVQRAFVMSELGQLAVADKRYDEAKRYLEEAVTLYPGNHQTHYNLAMVLSHLGDKEEAETQLELSREFEEREARFQKVIDEIIQQPNDANLRCEAGDLLLAQGKRQDAYSWFVSALRCDPAHAPTHRSLANYYADSGNEQMARQHLAMAAGSRGAGD